MTKNICILGAGAWGITLASLLAEKKFNTTLWEFDAKQIELLKKKRKLDYFPFVEIPKSIKITLELD